MAGKVESICEERVKPEIEKLGYIVLEIDYSKKVDGQNLTFVIDKENGININDCEKVHKMLNTLLDEINPTDDNPYILNVESAGLDRPLKCKRDFERNFGKEVEVKLYAKRDGKKSFIGNLVYFDDQVFAIETPTRMEFKMSDTAMIVPVIKF